MKKLSKKLKILLGLGVSIVVLALGAWLFFELHLSWLSLEDNLPFAVTWQEGDTAVHVNLLDIFDMAFDTQEPSAYVGNERIPMRDGIRIRNGRPYIKIRDVGVFNEGLNDALAAISAKDSSGEAVVIVNGLYGQGTEEQNALTASLLGGGEDAREKFELYFQWYNTVHELGHSITSSHGTYDGSAAMSLRHMVEEEQLVNSFAVAFWLYFGETEKIDELEAMVEYVLGNITPPVDNMSPVDYMRKAVDEGNFEKVNTLNNYGWFQFSIVRDILRERDALDLASILAQMTGMENILIQPGRKLAYPALGTDRVPQVLADAISALREDCGVDVQDVYVQFSTDPNAHSSPGSFPRSLLEESIADGRLIPAFR